MKPTALSLILGLTLLLLAACTGESVMYIGPDGDADGDATPDGDDSDGDQTDGDTPVDGDVLSDGDIMIDGDALIDGDLVVDGDSDEPPVIGPGPYPIDDVVLNWAPCSLYDGENDGLAECATVETPLFWDRPQAGGVMHVFAKRLRSSVATTAQLWLLHGGPGASGTHDFPSYMEAMQAQMPGLEILTLDHRGTGLSDNLRCPEQQSPESAGGDSIYYEELDDCIAYLKQTYGNGLAAYGTTYSAIDLAALIQHSRQDGIPVIIWGGSYGTYYAQRYLALYPQQADGVILEGISAPDGTFITMQQRRDKGGRRFLELCGGDEFCASKLGDDPATVVESLLTKLDSGHCPDLGMSGDYLRYMLGTLMYYHPLDLLIPPLIYRLDRCTYADAVAIYNLYMALFEDSGTIFGMDNYWSMVLNYNVVNSEMFAHPDFPDAASRNSYWDRVDETALFAYNSGPASQQFYEKWPKYSDPLYDDSWPDSDIPVLMLQGFLDPATWWDGAATVGEHFAGDLQTFVTFPLSPHNVVWGSPTASGEDCGLSLYLSFVADPTIEPDLSCLDDILPLDFSDTPYAYVFNTSDLWENDPRRASTIAPPPDAERLIRKALHARELMGPPPQGAPKNPATRP